MPGTSLCWAADALEFRGWDLDARGEVGLALLGGQLGGGDGRHLAGEARRRLRVEGGEADARGQALADLVDVLRLDLGLDDEAFAVRE